MITRNGIFQNAAGEELVDYLPHTDSTCMIFVESEVDKRNRLYKKVKDLGYAAELSRQDASQPAAGRGGFCKGRKKDHRQDHGTVSGVCRDDMENRHGELEKLICYVGDREVVTDEDVQAICTVHVTSRIFEMAGPLWREIRERPWISMRISSP